MKKWRKYDLYHLLEMDNSFGHRFLSIWVFPKKGYCTPKWMVYNGKPY